jgi:hypothetical protein
LWNTAFPAYAIFGGEISDTGFEGAHRIAALEPQRTPITFLRFNYLQPAFPFLAGMRNVLFFTIHSIEQVKNIGATVFERMLEAAASVQCFHAEPVVWHFNDAVMAQLNRPGAEERLRATQPKIAIHGRVDELYSAAAPWMNGWNRDLVHQLTRLADAGRIRIEFIDKFAAGDDPYNPSTFIQWRKV